MVETIKTDILIVGAGPVGAHAARLLADIGYDVVLIEKNERNRCGAQWVNGVPMWQLETSGLSRPPNFEIYHEGGLFSVISPIGKSRVSLNDAPILDIDMRHFGIRLLEAAESHPHIRVLYQTAFQTLLFDGSGRPNGANTTAGQIQFRLIIDASGLSAVVRKQVPLLAKLCPAIGVENICTAAQEVCEISDTQGAQSFLELNDAQPGELLAWVNVAGGFSLLRVHISHDLQRVAFLTGARALPGTPSAKDLIRKFTHEHRWVGSSIFGGQRPVPLRRPFAALCAPGIALLGDAGSQVYSAHASGIGISLVAARLLSETIKDAAQKDEDIGSGEVLSRYAYVFHKSHGSLLGNSDAARRFSQNLSAEDTHLMIDRQLMTRRMVMDSLGQKPVGLHLSDVPTQILQTIRNPLLARRVLKLAAKVPLISAAVKLYPRHGIKDPEKLLRFESTMERLVAF